MMQCDGCGQVVKAVAEPDARGFRYCPACVELREQDVTVRVLGRTLTHSELTAQAEDDDELANAMRGDSVQEQLA